MTGKAVQKGQEDMSGRKEAEKKGLHRKRQKKISGRHIVLKKQSGIRMLKDRREQSAGNDGAALLVIRTLRSPPSIFMMLSPSKRFHTHCTIKYSRT